MKALIAMSGGVDSSIAAKLMRDRGYDCIGCTMQLYQNEDAGIASGKTCCTLDDAEDARSVAYSLGMPFYVFRFTEQFREQVICPFIAQYTRGLTPNPCIECNRKMKFETLLERAKTLGCDLLVTGHYARVAEENGKFVLKKAADPSKDQSYVLYCLTQEQLRHIAFPCGELKKTEVRSLAEKSDFVNADKPDSQDICFVPDGDYARIIELHTGKKAEPGNFVDASGKILGRHKGIIHYTIGQRRGLGIAAEYPLYVLAIRPEENEVVLGKNEDLFSREAIVRDFNWISGEAPKDAIRCAAKIRYRHPEQPATVTPIDATSIRLTFDQPQRAITPGQAAVLYDGDTVLGGGTIMEAVKEEGKC